MGADVCIWVHMDAFGCTCMHLGAYACAPVYAYVFEHTQVRPFIRKTCMLLHAWSAYPTRALTHVRI